MVPKISNYAARDRTIVDLCRGKRVLHLGCAGFTDHPVEDKVRLARQSLHQRLSGASECIGIDSDRQTIEQLNANGIFSNVRVGDAEDLAALSELGLFDVVLAGDIIEHLTNPGRMLDGARVLLKPGGHLILTTPNAFGLANFIRYAMGSFQEGAQHVLNFNVLTLTQLLERCGWCVEERMTCYQELAAKKAGLLFPALRLCLETFPRFGGTLLIVARANL